MKKRVIKFHKLYLFLLVFSVLLPRFVFAEILPSWTDEKAYKPSPVLFLHGFALGNSDSWNEFINGKHIASPNFEGLSRYFYSDYSNNTKPKYHGLLSFLERINFNDPNGSIDTYDSGKYNPQGNSDGWADKLKTEMGELINKYRFKGSALKINLVCHSMGGLASREFLTNPKYGNFYLNIDKMVTIGTPHAGTPLANINKVKDVLSNSYKYVWEVPYYGKTKNLSETSTEGMVVKLVHCKISS